MNHASVSFVQGGVLTVSQLLFKTQDEALVAVKKGLKDHLDINLAHKEFDEYQDLQFDVSVQESPVSEYTFLISFEATLLFPYEDDEDPETIVEDNVDWSLNNVDTHFSVKHSEISDNEN